MLLSFSFFSLRFSNTWTLLLWVHYNCILTSRHFQHSSLHTRRHVSPRNVFIIQFLHLCDYFFLSLFFLNFINRCYIFQYKRYPIKSRDFNKEMPIGGLLRLPPSYPPRHTALLLRFLCLHTRGINTWCLIHISDKSDLRIQSVTSPFLFSVHSRVIYF
jgi:hypothetical protein